jgi:hypothetical protein
MTDHTLLTITETADLVRAPVAALRYWRHLGTGPRSFRIGRRVVYHLADTARTCSPPPATTGSCSPSARSPTKAAKSTR